MNSITIWSNNLPIIPPFMILKFFNLYASLLINLQNFYNIYISLSCNFNELTDDKLNTISLL